MRRYSDVVLIIVVFLVTSEALSAGKLHNQLKPSELTSQKTRPSHGFLRAVSTAGGDDEERGMLGSKIYMQLSKLAKKANMKELSQNLKHKSWRVSGDNPQTLFQKNSEKWKGKPDSDLMGDSEFIHYKVLAKAWPEVQYRKGTWHRPGEWEAVIKEEKKRGQL
ncbi:hypothetical protein PC121_g11110 [Phytophthora cactorum]|nr:hypothetical protein PC120_g9233 [Phytophthora cactorum]KAG3065892.1 hypothetical protein PC121_g11110 [Phytophthora cactorum]